MSNRKKIASVVPKAQVTFAPVWGAHCPDCDDTTEILVSSDSNSSQVAFAVERDDGTSVFMTVDLTEHRVTSKWLSADDL